MKRCAIEFTGWYPANGRIAICARFCAEQDAQGWVDLIESDGHVDYWQLVGDRRIVWTVGGESTSFETQVDLA